MPPRANRRHPHRGSRRASANRLRTALLRICGAALFLSILIVYSSPVRKAAEHARDAVLDATAAGRLAVAHEAAVISWAVRYGITLDLAAAIEHAAVAEGIDPDLGFRLVRVESGFREQAVSSAGARGLTQLMPGTAESLRPGITGEEIFERDTNLRLGFRYLRWLLRVHDGNLAEALHAYNRGPGTVARIRAAGGDPANGYAEQVLRGAHSQPPYRGNGLVPTWPPRLPRL